MVTRGLSERRALTVVHMSAAALRYVRRPDPDPTMRDRIIALAHRHRRYGAGMIYLNLRQDGQVVNHKRVDRLYAEARLQVRRRRRKKVPLADRQPLARPPTPNVVWSADFVFDRTAEGRVLKCLTIVDDATTEAVAVVPARALRGVPVTRVLEELAITRGLPQVLRTDNGLEFCGRAMLTWAHARGVTLRLAVLRDPQRSCVISHAHGCRADRAALACGPEDFIEKTESSSVAEALDGFATPHPEAARDIRQANISNRVHDVSCKLVRCFLATRCFLCATLAPAVANGHGVTVKRMRSGECRSGRGNGIRVRAGISRRF
jgi:hypothetical protein